MFFTVTLVLVLTVIFVRIRRLSEARTERNNEDTAESLPTETSIHSNNEEGEKKNNVLNKEVETTHRPEQAKEPEIIIFYASQNGKSKDLSLKLSKLYSSSRVLDISEYDVDDYCKEEAICVFVMSTWVDGQAPENGAWFCQWLEDMAFDFKTDKDYLKSLKYTIFGLGSKEYNDNYNKVARNVNSWFSKLGAKRIFPVQLADLSLGDCEEDFMQWAEGLIKFLKEGESSYAIPTEIKYESSEEEESDEDVEDLEDIGEKYTVKKKEDSKELREMMNPTLRKSLTKQGYKIVGSHSGVKICRWTKAMLRGRGGCYKHSFYGIESHRCMETTPSLACANKCVFCWRHHTNPVGTEWKWKMDNAKFILDGAMENHYKMIKQLRGVPGVNAERFKEAQEIKHCALSLVG